jgi:hypothetical protein
MKIAAITLLLALMSMAAITPGSAQTGQEAVDAFPNRPVRIIVPFPAGGPTDIMARILGQKLSDAWKQHRESSGRQHCDRCPSCGDGEPGRLHVACRHGHDHGDESRDQH